MKTALVILVLCALQGLNTSEVNPRSIIDDIIKEAEEEAKEAITYISDKINTAVKDARKEIQTILNNLRQAEKDIINKTEESLKNFVTKVEEDIQDAERNAVQTGVDVAQCIAGERDAALALTGNLGRGIKTCVTNEVAEGERRAQLVFSSIVNAVKFSEVAAENITKCFQVGDSLKTLTCVLKESADVTAGTLQIVNDIKQKVSSAEAFVDNAIPDIVGCADSRLLEAQRMVGQILIDIATCVQQKLRPNTEL